MVTFCSRWKFSLKVFAEVSSRTPEYRVVQLLKQGIKAKKANGFFQSQPGCHIRSSPFLSYGRSGFISGKILLLLIIYEEARCLQWKKAVSGKSMCVPREAVYKSFSAKS